MARFSQLKTHGGYLAGEVTSALQKSIRRGDERGAVFWASELDLSGYGKYVWKRLKIIASEDIGPAAVFFASDDSRWITGETLYITGGYR